MESDRREDVKALSEVEDRLSYYECGSCMRNNRCFFHICECYTPVDMFPESVVRDDAYDDQEVDLAKAAFRDAWFDYESYHQT